MSDDVKGTTTHQQLITLLTQQGARFRVMEHDAVGKCEAVSEIRGTDLQADLSQLASHFGGIKASLASPAEVDTLTACVFGAIPPFSFHPDLALVADPLLFERFDEIAFNAGLLEKSVIMDTQDYLRIARPELVTFHKA